MSIGEAQRMALGFVITSICGVQRGLLLCLATALLVASVRAEIVSANYTEPTTRYGHAVLGDAIEYGALEMRLRDGRTLSLTLPESRVFEDIAPRLVDLDSDGAPEIVAIESSLTNGARLSVYGVDGLIAATPFIGRANRWLAPLGAADLDGDGKIELAYIDRPHLARTLRIWRFKDGQLVHLADQAGLTNHRIGEDFISGGIRNCGGKPEIITANADWTRIIATTFDGQVLNSRDIGKFTGRQSLEVASRHCDQ